MKLFQVFLTFSILIACQSSLGQSMTAAEENSDQPTLNFPGNLSRISGIYSDIQSGMNSQYDPNDPTIRFLQGSVGNGKIGQMCAKNPAAMNALLSLASYNLNKLLHSPDAMSCLGRASFDGAQDFASGVSNRVDQATQTGAVGRVRSGIGNALQLLNALQVEVGSNIQDAATVASSGLKPAIQRAFARNFKATDHAEQELRQQINFGLENGMTYGALRSLILTYASRTALNIALKAKTSGCLRRIRESKAPGAAKAFAIISDVVGAGAEIANQMSFINPVATGAAAAFDILKRVTGKISRNIIRKKTNTNIYTFLKKTCALSSFLKSRIHANCTMNCQSALVNIRGSLVDKSVRIEACIERLGVEASIPTSFYNDLEAKLTRDMQYGGLALTDDDGDTVNSDLILTEQGVEKGGVRSSNSVYQEDREIFLSDMGIDLDDAFRIPYLDPGSGGTDDTSEKQQIDNEARENLEQYQGLIKNLETKTDFSLKHRMAAFYLSPNGQAMNQKLNTIMQQASNPITKIIALKPGHIFGHFCSKHWSNLQSDATSTLDPEVKNAIKIYSYGGNDNPFSTSGGQSESAANNDRTLYRSGIEQLKNDCQTVADIQDSMMSGREVNITELTNMTNSLSPSSNTFLATLNLNQIAAEAHGPSARNNELLYSRANNPSNYYPYQTQHSAYPGQEESTTNNLDQRLRGYFPEITSEPGKQTYVADNYSEFRSQLHYNNLAKASERDQERLRAIAKLRASGEQFRQFLDRNLGHAANEMNYLLDLVAGTTNSGSNIQGIRDADARAAVVKAMENQVIMCVDPSTYGLNLGDNNVSPEQLTSESAECLNRINENWRNFFTSNLEFVQPIGVPEGQSHVPEGQDQFEGNYGKTLIEVLAENKDPFGFQERNTDPNNISDLSVSEQDAIKESNQQVANQVTNNVYPQLRIQTCRDLYCPYRHMLFSPPAERNRLMPWTMVESAGSSSQIIPKRTSGTKAKKNNSLGYFLDEVADSCEDIEDLNCPQDMCGEVKDMIVRSANLADLPPPSDVEELTTEQTCNHYANPGASVADNTGFPAQNPNPADAIPPQGIGQEDPIAPAGGR